MIEGFTQRKLPDRSAWLTAPPRTGATDPRRGRLRHLAGSLRRPNALYGLPFGAAVFAGDYIALPAAGLYKQIWEYDAKALAIDLSAHLAYGTGTASAFWLLASVG